MNKYYISIGITIIIFLIFISMIFFKLNTTKKNVEETKTFTNSTSGDFDNIQKLMNDVKIQKEIIKPFASPNAGYGGDISAIVMTIPNYGKIINLMGHLSDDKTFKQSQSPVAKINKPEYYPKNPIYLTSKTHHLSTPTSLPNMNSKYFSSIIEITKDGEIITHKNTGKNPNITQFLLNGLMYAIPDNK